MTVQRSLPFWDCGEFIASAYIMGIPHPPGFPTYMLVGRLFSLIPFVEDISWRINYLSVVSSAVTSLFCYLVVVRIVRMFFDSEDMQLGRSIAYIGGLTGALFVTFSSTNWANSVEAETYGIALALSVAIFWLTLKFHELRGTYKANRIMILAMYLAMLGVGAHMTVYLVVPVCAIFFVLKHDAPKRDYLMICGYAIVELLMVLLFADGRGGAPVFKALSVMLGIGLFAMIYRRINWGILIAIASVSTIMISFSLYLSVALPGAIAAMLGLAYMSKAKGWKVQWKNRFGHYCSLLHGIQYPTTFCWSAQNMIHASMRTIYPEITELL